MGVAIILVARTISHMQVNNIDLQVVYSLFYFSRNMCLDLHKKYVPWSVTKISKSKVKMCLEQRCPQRVLVCTQQHTKLPEVHRSLFLFL